MLKETREKLGLSQKDMAEMMSVTITSISRWENEKEKFPNARAEQLADIKRSYEFKMLVAESVAPGGVSDEAVKFEDETRGEIDKLTLGLADKGLSIPEARNLIFYVLC